MMMTLSQKILSHAAQQPEGALLQASALGNMGSRNAIDQALSRLAKRGQLIRAGRGVYVLPVQNRFGARAPEASKVIGCIAEQSGETIVPNEAAAANALGLTTQVPVRQTYLTSGHSRHLKLGAQVVELKRAPSWKLRLPNRPAGQALRALAWAGERNVHAAANRLKKQLSSAELTALAGVSTRYMPAWIANELRCLSAYG